MPELQVWQWALAAVCAFCVGVAKTGVPGIGILVVPMMVQVAGDARQSAGWLLPLLCFADLFAVSYYRRNAAAGRLFSLIPSVLAGMALGALALSLPEGTIRPLIGVIVLAMLSVYLWRKRHPEALAVTGSGAPYGIVAGFSTTVANAAGPAMSLYLLSRKLTKEEFVATGAWFFFVVNLAKTPIYAWHGLFSWPSLTLDVMLSPAVFCGALGGRWLLRRVSPELFEFLVLSLTAASAVLLFR
ncbi:MAG: sulfite exporter TauE/SafE family protein [Bryobacterales bacterium]|nr:sulfite exporter TauE/SafE family protein [Bryobacterales bacterium]